MDFARSTLLQGDRQLFITPNFSNLAEISELGTPSPFTWARVKHLLEAAAFHLWLMNRAQVN